MGFEAIAGLLSAGLGIVLWWLNNRAATKKEKKEQNAADIHKRTADIIDDELR